MDIMTVVALAKAGEWQKLRHNWKDQIVAIDLEEQKKIFSAVLQKLTTLLPNHLLGNVKKWLLGELVVIWKINLNQVVVREELLKYADSLPHQELMNLSSLLWEQGRIEETHQLLVKLLENSLVAKEVAFSNELYEQLSYFQQFALTHKALLQTITFGNQDVAMRAYKLFYKQYFAAKNLEDTESILWEELWQKLAEIKEPWLTWQILKLDVGLITDIIIKHKTGLKIPYFRKKREISQSILLRKRLPSLYTTLWKYLSEIESEYMVELWETVWKNEENIHHLSGSDLSVQLIMKQRQLNRPLSIPVISNHKPEETLTVIVSGKMQESRGDDFSWDQGNTYYNNNESKIKIHLSDSEQEMSWKSHLEALMHHRQYEEAYKLVLKNKDSLDQNEVEEYLLLQFEMLLKMGRGSEVLQQLEEEWKKVQELETFKALKYIEGEALWSLARRNEAVDCFRKVVEIDPSYKLARWRLIEFNA